MWPWKWQDCPRVLQKLDVLTFWPLCSPSRHYFVSSSHITSNPGEQFYMFTIIAAWLINTAGRLFPEPQEYDEPNTTVANILAELRAFVSDGKPSDVVPVFLMNEHVMWPLCSLRVLKWISPPPNWSLVLGSRSVLCWTVWLRRRWSGQASPSGGTTQTFAAHACRHTGWEDIVDLSVGEVGTMPPWSINGHSNIHQ